MTLISIRDTDTTKFFSLAGLSFEINLRFASCSKLGPPASKIFGLELSFIKIKQHLEKIHILRLSRMRCDVLYANQSEQEMSSLIFNEVTK